MDFTNNYGVHPFWPLSNRWFYGDAVFIAEPLLWAACAPLAFTFRTKLARFIVGAVLAIGIGLALFSGLVPLLPAIVLIVVIAAMLLLGWRASPRVALLGGVGLWLAVTAMFVVTSQVVAHRIEAIASALFPDERPVDDVLTPMPANPLVLGGDARADAGRVDRRETRDAGAGAFPDSRRRLPQPQSQSAEQRAAQRRSRCQHT